MNTNQGIDQDKGEESQEAQSQNKLISPTNEKIQKEENHQEMPPIAIIECKDHKQLEIPSFQDNQVDVAQIDDQEENQGPKEQSEADDNIKERENQSQISGQSNQEYQPSPPKFYEFKAQAIEPSSQPSSQGQEKGSTKSPQQLDQFQIVGSLSLAWNDLIEDYECQEPIQSSPKKVKIQENLLKKTQQEPPIPNADLNVEQNQTQNQSPCSQCEQMEYNSASRLELYKNTANKAILCLQHLKEYAKIHDVDIGSRDKYTINGIKFFRFWYCIICKSPCKQSQCQHQI